MMHTIAKIGLSSVVFVLSTLFILNLQFEEHISKRSDKCAFVVSELFGNHTKDYQTHVLDWMVNSHINSVEKLIETTDVKHDVHIETLYILKGVYSEQSLSNYFNNYDFINVFSNNKEAVEYADTVAIERGCNQIVFTRLDADDMLSPTLYNDVFEISDNTVIEYAMIFGTSKLDEILLGAGLCEKSEVLDKAYLMALSQTVIFQTDVWFDIGFNSPHFSDHTRIKNTILNIIQEHYPDVENIPSVNTHNTFSLGLYIITPLSSHFLKDVKPEFTDCTQEKLDELKKDFPKYDYIFDTPLMNISEKDQCMNNKWYRTQPLLRKKCEKYF